MTTPVHVVNVMWFTEPFLLASLCLTLRSCIKNPTIHRGVLIFSCALGIIANGNLIASFGGYKVNFSILYLFGVTTFNLSLWSARLYVCMRMAKLSPSPAMSNSFHHLAYTVIVMFVLTMVTYIASAVEFYQTNSFELPAGTNNTAFACNLAANLIFELTSIFLHVKSLKMFATSNSTGVKLYIISVSTLACVLFGLIQIGFHYNQDLLTELIFSGLQVAILPSSLVLGETLAVQYGARWGKPVHSSHNSQVTSGTAKSTLIGAKSNKGPPATGSLVGKEDPIRKSATLSSQPSISN